MEANAFWPEACFLKCEKIVYRKVASSSLSRLVAHFLIFRRLMKGKFDAYVLCDLWPKASKIK